MNRRSYLPLLEVATFRLDGAHAWPSTGDIVDVKTRQVIARLTDETGAAVMNEKVVEVLAPAQTTARSLPHSAQTHLHVRGVRSVRWRG